MNYREFWDGFLRNRGVKSIPKLTVITKMYETLLAVMLRSWSGIGNGGKDHQRLATGGLNHRSIKPQVQCGWSHGRKTALQYPERWRLTTRI